MRNATANEPASEAHFLTTRWTQVLAAKGESAQAQQALSELCAAYYGPVVGFLRREGRDEDAARELAHEFFAKVLESRGFSSADPQRGRFRSYLLGALKHFLANRRARQMQEKRGGIIPHQEYAETDTASASEPAPAVALPEAAFDRDWALNVLERAMSRLKEEWQEKNAAEQFDKLKPWLTGGENTGSQADLAAQLGMKEGAARVILHRFRRRFGDLVKAEIAQTVNGPAEVADEMRLLIEALSIER